MKKANRKVLCTILFLAIAGISCTNQKAKSTEVIAVETSKINILYHGIENPVRVAISDVSANDIEVTIDNGRMIGSSGEYIAVTEHSGIANLKVYAKGNELRNVEFRVHNIPDPMSRFVGISGYDIKKEDLSSLDELEVFMPQGFSFDLKFSVTEFAILAVNEGYTLTYSSNSSKLNDDQKGLLKKLKHGQRFHVVNIKAIGPDGAERFLSDITYNIIK